MKKALWLLLALSILPSLGRASEDIDDAVSKIAKSFAKSQKGQPPSKGPDGKATVAILPLYTLDGKTSEFGKYFAERLLTVLYDKKGFSIVDRSLLDKVLKEQKLDSTGLIDEKTAQQLGKMLGADLIGTGTYTILGKKLDVNTRLIVTETAMVASAAEDKIDIDESVDTLLGPQARPPAAEPAPQTTRVGLPAAEPGPVTPPAPLEVKKGKLLFEENCAKPPVGERHGKGPKGPWSAGRKDGECWIDASRRHDAGYTWWTRKGYKDFILEARLRRRGGGPVAYGASFRARGGSHPYAFWILEGGEYVFAKKPGKAWITLERGKDASIKMGPDADNDLRISAVGPVIQVYVNDHRVALLADNTMKGGKVGLFAAPGTEMRFSDFRVYDAKP